MTQLTEDMVFMRTKVLEIANIRKLNAWGCNLNDVTLVRQMPRVELLSLSVNDISTLEDFQYCTALEELFLRSNKITDINQVCYLQNLPNLRVLMLKDNPCAEFEGYRWTVLRALPNITNLDDIEVTALDREKARRFGQVLVHPEKEFNEDNSNTDDTIEVSHTEDYSDAEETRLSSEEQTYFDTMDTQNANCQAAPEKSSYPAENNQLNRGISNIESCDNEEYTKYQQPGSSSCSSDSERDPNRNNDYVPEPETWSSECVVEMPRRILQRHYPSANDIANIAKNNEKEKPHLPCERSTRKPRRISQMNSNVLSAVLLLIKELDYSSLEIVENAVRSSLNDYEDN